VAESDGEVLVDQAPFGRRRTSMNMVTSSVVSVLASSGAWSSGHSRSRTGTRTYIGLLLDDNGDDDGACSSPTVSPGRPHKQDQSPMVGTPDPVLNM